MAPTAEPCTAQTSDQEHEREELKNALKSTMSSRMPANNPTRRDEDVCTEPLSGESSSGSGAEDCSSDEHQATTASHAQKANSKRKKKKKRSKAKGHQQTQSPQHQQQVGGVPYFLANPGYPMMIPPVFFQSQGFTAETAPPCMAYPCYMPASPQAGAMFVPVPMEQSAQMYPYYADPRTMQMMQPACSSSTAATPSQFLSPVTPEEAALLNRDALVGMDDDLPGPPIATVADGHGPEDCNLFVFHLPNDMNNLSLYHLFANFGPVASSRIMVDSNTGRSRGFGFVSFTTRDSAEAAQARLDGYNIGKKRLKVQFKTPPSRSPTGTLKSSVHDHSQDPSDVQDTTEMLSNVNLKES